VAELYRPGDLIIVHDYHLLLAPKMIREALGQVPVPGAGWAASAMPSPAINSNGKRMDWDQTPTQGQNGRAAKEKVNSLLGKVGDALGHLGIGSGEGEDKKEPHEIMIGMFVHTPWPSSEIFRCLPSKCIIPRRFSRQEAQWTRTSLCTRIRADK
jgi:trehalose 6-phosphate synthase/phosphatase